MQFLRSRTTWAGIAAIITAVGYSVSTGDFTSLVPASLAGVGLILSQDQT